MSANINDNLLNLTISDLKQLGQNVFGKLINLTPKSRLVSKLIELGITRKHIIKYFIIKNEPSTINLLINLANNGLSFDITKDQAIELLSENCVIIENIDQSIAKCKIEDLQKILSNCHLNINGSHSDLMLRLKQFENIADITELGRIDNYYDWELGGNWITQLINKFINDIEPDFDYDTSECTCETDLDYDGYCRCLKITNIKLNTTRKGWYYSYVRQCLSNLTTTVYVSDIGKYYISRVLALLMRDAVKNNDFDPLFIVQAVNGYYGQEMEVNITIKNELISKLKDGMNLRKLLELEYGQLGQNIEFIEIIEIDPKLIKIPNNLHFERCLKSNIYPGYEQIVGVCTKRNQYYILKDGYHRLASCYDNPTVKIIVAEFNEDVI